MEEEEQPVKTESPVRNQDYSAWEPKKKAPWIPLLVILALLVLVVGGFFFIKGRTEKVEPTPTPEPSITEQPTPQPAPLLKREEIKIKVLNGTGISGEAAFLKDKLASAGYTNVEVGNATRQDYTDTQVSFGSIPEEIKTEIVALLEDNYKAVKETTGVGTGFDLEIITGFRPGQTPKPTPTPSPTPKASPTPTPTPKPSPTP